MRHSVPFILFRTKRSSGYLDLIDCVAVHSHLGGSVAVAPVSGAEAPTGAVGELVCVATGPEEVGTGVTEVPRFDPFTFDTLCARGGSESLEVEEAGDAALSSSDGGIIGC